MESIKKSTFKFLKDLGINNNRPWFTENKSIYQDAVDNIKAFNASFLEEFQKKDTIEKMKLFRIYRDVRFSKDKTPYKTNFGTGFTREKPRLRGGYYINIQPGNTFVGGGFWQPEAQDLKRIRQEFEIDDTQIREIISDKTFTTYFPNGLQGEELKTAPKGFDKDHPAIDLIRKKAYVASRTFTDQEVTSPNFGQEVLNSFMTLRPWFDYMSEVLTTNLNGESLID